MFFPANFSIGKTVFWLTPFLGALYTKIRLIFTDFKNVQLNLVKRAPKQVFPKNRFL